MSENNINTAIDGTIIQASDVNQYKTALSQDFVARNVSGIPTDQAGSIGTSLKKWLNGWFIKLFSNKFILGYVEDTSPDIENVSDSAEYSVFNSKSHIFNVDGLAKTVIDQDGFNGGYVKTASVNGSALIDNTVNGAKLTTGTVTYNKMSVANSGSFALVPFLVTAGVTPVGWYKRGAGATITSIGRPIIVSIQTGTFPGGIVNQHRLLVNHGSGDVSSYEIETNGLIGQNYTIMDAFQAAGTHTYSVESYYDGVGTSTMTTINVYVTEI